MSRNGRIAISYIRYIRQLCLFVFSSSLALGLVIGAFFLAIGGTTMNVDGDLEIGAFDGAWLILMVPTVALLVLVLLSPLSFLIHKLLLKKRADNRPVDS